MSLRISSLGLLLGLAACSASVGGKVDTQEAAETVPCTFGAAEKFDAKCPVERNTVDGKAVLTISHPDGSFRRLEMVDGGKNYAAADGADVIEGGPNGKEIEIILGDGHYLLPGPESVATPPPR